VPIVLSRASFRNGGIDLHDQIRRFGV